MLKQALHSYLSVSSLIVKLWNMTEGLVVAININNLPTFHSSVNRHRLFLVTFCRLIQSFRQFKMGNEFWFEQPLHNCRKWKRQGTVSMRGHCSQRWLPLMSSNVSCKKMNMHSSIYVWQQTPPCCTHRRHNASFHSARAEDRYFEDVHLTLPGTNYWKSSQSLFFNNVDESHETRQTHAAAVLSCGKLREHHRKTLTVFYSFNVESFCKK